VKCHIVTSLAIAQAVAFLVILRPTRVLFQSKFSFSFFNYLHLFILFLPLFTFENDRRAVGFSTCCDRNYTIITEHIFRMSH
jgi:hypothetical protein